MSLKHFLIGFICLLASSVYADEASDAMSVVTAINENALSFDMVVEKTDNQGITHEINITELLNGGYLADQISPGVWSYSVLSQVGILNNVSQYSTAWDKNAYDLSILRDYIIYSHKMSKDGLDNPNPMTYYGWLWGEIKREQNEVGLTRDVKLKWIELWKKYSND